MGSAGSIIEWGAFRNYCLIKQSRENDIKENGGLFLS